MATSVAPRTVETLPLNQFLRQLYQWKVIEKKTWLQVEESFETLFWTLKEATGVDVSITERQWKKRFQRWTRSSGVTRAQNGELAAMPEDLKRWPLWYERDRQLIFYHRCTPEKCNSCNSATKQMGDGHPLKSPSAPTQDHCLNCGNRCAYCVIAMPAMPHDMTRSYSGPRTSTPYPTTRNNFDDGSSISGNAATFYSSHPGLPSSSIADVQENSLLRSGINSGFGDPGFSLTRRPANLATQFQYMNPTGTGTLIQDTTQPPSASSAPGQARKRSRRSSPQPNVVTEPPHDEYDSLADWDAHLNLAQ